MDQIRPLKINKPPSLPVWWYWEVHPWVGVRFRSGHESGGQGGDSSPCKKRMRQETPSLLACARKGQVRTDPDRASSLTRLPASRTRRSKCCLSQPIHGTSLQRPKPTKTFSPCSVAHCMDSHYQDSPLCFGPFKVCFTICWDGQEPKSSHQLSSKTWPFLGGDWMPQSLVGHLQSFCRSQLPGAALTRTPGLTLCS